MIDPLNIVITGVGGQGNIIASQILATAAVREGLCVNTGETYGAAQRGGSVTSQVRISAKREFGPLIPANQTHAVIGFEPIETIRVLPGLANPKTVVVFNDRPQYPAAVLSGQAKYPSTGELVAGMKKLVENVTCMNATDLAVQAGNPKTMNVVMVGALAGTGMVPIKNETFLSVIEDMFSNSSSDVNVKAFELGEAAIRSACGGKE